MAGELSHLSPATQAIVDLPAPERLAHLRGQWWISHPRAQAALDKLEAVLTQGPGRIRPPNLLIVGPTNNGKSMVAEKFRRLHPATPSACGGRELTPVVVMQMPSEPSVRRFYSALLTALNAPVSFNVPGARLESHALELLRAIEARVLIIDELHNMLAGAHAKRAEFLNTLRFLGNELRIPIVGLGTKHAQIAVRSDDQLENRFEPVPLPAWEDDLEFARLLSSFESALPLREPSGLGAGPELRSLVLRRSTGLIGEVAALLTSATAHALAHGRERIDRAVLDHCDYRGPDERRAIFEASFPHVR
ncbi:MAG: TniB family NTP-binding protein [Thermomicrobiales bacterium]